MRRRLVLVVMALAACQPTHPAADVVLQIDRETIRWEQFEQYLDANLIDGGGVLASDVMSALFDQYVDERLLERLARDELGGGSTSPPTQAVEHLLLAFPPIVVTEADIEARYRQTRERYTRSERIVLDQFLLDDRDLADGVQQQWAAGAGREELIARFGESEGFQPGQQIEVAESELPAGFAEVLSRLEVGEVSAVLVAEYGFHVFRLVDRLPAGELALEDVQSRLLDEMTNERRQDQIEKLVQLAAGRYNVQVFARNLPFNYDGVYGSQNTASTGS